ncbi:hypothetical protein, partial [Congregibacter sp.]|uniref:hypothetical protein n=1 Tax=Congregibacter sp. TaxID=2744308 RepID=UPI0039E693E5
VVPSTAVEQSDLTESQKRLSESRARILIDEGGVTGKRIHIVGQDLGRVPSLKSDVDHRLALESVRSVLLQNSAVVGKTESYDFVIDSVSVSKGILNVRFHQAVDGVSAPQSQIVAADGETVSIIHLHYVIPDQAVMKSNARLSDNVLFSLAVTAVGSNSDSSSLRIEDVNAKIGYQIDPKTLEYRLVYEAWIFGEIVWIDAIAGHVVLTYKLGNTDSRKCRYIGQGAAPSGSPTCTTAIGGVFQYRDFRIGSTCMNDSVATADCGVTSFNQIKAGITATKNWANTSLSGTAPNDFSVLYNAVMPTSSNTSGQGARADGNVGVYFISAFSNLVNLSGGNVTRIDVGGHEYMYLWWFANNQSRSSASSMLTTPAVPP